MQNQPSQEVLSNFRQELLTLELNYERQAFRNNCEAFKDN